MVDANLRWQPDEGFFEDAYGVLSADFFNNNVYQSSMQARVDIFEGEFHLAFPRAVHGEQRKTQPCNGNLKKIGPDRLFLSCDFGPEAGQSHLAGELLYQGPYLRKLKLCIAMAPGISRPREFLWRAGQAETGADSHAESEWLVSLESVLARADMKVETEWMSLVDWLEGYDPDNHVFDETRIWTEKELHELMVATFPGKDQYPDWRLNLMILPGYFGKSRSQSWHEEQEPDKRIVGIMFDRISDKQLCLPDGDHFYNRWPRQGAAIFPDAIEMRVPVPGELNSFELDRELMFWLVHELGHVMNLPHAPAEACSFMGNPDHYPTGRPDFWANFDFRFTAAELLHLLHGCYQGVVPGGKFSFNEKALGSLSFKLSPTKSSYQYPEPVTIEVSVTNHGELAQRIPSLNPSFEDFGLWVQKPNGDLSRYMPPSSICCTDDSLLLPGQTQSHLALVSIDRDGFWIEQQGDYHVFLNSGQDWNLDTSPRAETDFRLIRESTELMPLDLKLNWRDVAMFIYLSGGEHLRKAKESLMALVTRHPQHPLAPQANIALGLNRYDGQTGLQAKTDRSPSPVESIFYFFGALMTDFLPNAIRQMVGRLIEQALEDFYPKSPERDQGELATHLVERGQGLNLAQIINKVWFLNMVFQMKGGDEAVTTHAILLVSGNDSNQTSYKLTTLDQESYNHSGTGELRVSKKSGEQLVAFESEPNPFSFRFSGEIGLREEGKTLVMNGTFSNGSMGGDDGGQFYGIGNGEPLHPQVEPGAAGGLKRQPAPISIKRESQQKETTPYNKPGIKRQSARANQG